MKRTMVYLPDELNKNLKRLAVERETSVAELVREATTALLEEDKEDLAIAKRRIAEIHHNPSLLTEFKTPRKIKNRK